MLMRMNYEKGAMEPIEVESKNNLPIGTVLHLHGYNEPDFVIARNFGVNPAFPCHGASYLTIDLGTYEQGQHSASSLYWPSEGIRGIHTEITGRTIPESDIPALLVKVEQAKEEREERERRDAEERAAAIAKIRAENPHLTQEGQNKKLWGPTLAAANIRTELKRAFPGVKFSVRSEKYSGGDSVNIGWTDGPLLDAVKTITDKYQEGHFNGMEDIYEHNHNNLWPGCFGGAKYIFENRHYSRGAIEKAAHDLGIKIIWNDAGYWTTEDYEDNRRIYQALSQIDAYVKPEEKPEPVKAQDIITADGVMVTVNEERNGIEIRFPKKPDQSVLDNLKANGWRWSRFGGCWYNRRNDQNMSFAESVRG